MTRVADIDRHWVEARRAANTPWSHIARMAGVREADLRAAFELKFAVPSPAEPETPAQVSPEHLVREALRRRGVRLAEAHILSMMWAAQGELRTSTVLIAGLKDARPAYDLAWSARSAGRKLGLTYRYAHACGYALTTEGLRILDRMVGFAAVMSAEEAPDEEEAA